MSGKEEPNMHFTLWLVVVGTATRVGNHPKMHAQVASECPISTCIWSPKPWPSQITSVHF